MLLTKLKKSPRKLLKTIKKNWPEAILVVFAFCFSWWLMWHTFSYKDNQMLIAAKVWSDFAANIPLIRSFSWGGNWPPCDPLFAGEQIHYHFLFYLIVGLLERFGLPLDFALNLPSLLSFSGLVLVIYFLAKLIFKSRFVAFLSVSFFLFNSSLSFLEFFHQHPFSLNTLSEIINNRNFPSFGPYDGKIVSAFWSLNIYTNQRHLALAYFLILFLCFLFLKSEINGQQFTLKRALLAGFIIGIFPIIHSVGYGMLMVIFSVFFLIFSRQRRPLFVTLLIAFLIGFPQLFLIRVGGQGNFRFNPGYLIAGRLNIKNFLHYWFYNLGLSLFFIPLGFWKSKKLAKKVFLAFIPLFFIPNFFQFSREMAANHKFLNLFIIVGNMFSAYLIFLIWQKNVLGKILATIFTFFLVFSGIVDFFPIKNDSYMVIPDAQKDSRVDWIKNNTPPKSTFLNSSYLYHPASLAGRLIFLGWPYFPWAGGLDSDKRVRIMRNIYENRNPQEICRLLKENKIDYFTVEDVLNDPNLPKIESWFFQNNFKYSFKDLKSGMQIYSVKDNCR